MPVKNELTEVLAFRTDKTTALRFDIKCPYHFDKGKVLRRLLEMFLDGKVKVDELK